MGTSIVLEPLTGGQVGGELRLAGPTQVVIGRSRSCSLRLPDDPTVSRHHCLLDLDEDVRVQDLGSRNGTFVNGAPIGMPSVGRGHDTMACAPHAVLRPGDELRVGCYVFRVKAAAPGAEAACGPVNAQWGLAAPSRACG